MNQTMIALMVRYAIGTGNFNLVAEEKAKEELLDSFAANVGVERKAADDAE